MKPLIPIILLITACGGSDDTTYTLDSRVDDMLEEMCESAISCEDGVSPSHEEIVDCVRSEFAEDIENGQEAACSEPYYQDIRCMYESQTCIEGDWDINDDCYSSGDAFDECMLSLE
jgi:hypothetical protein